MVPMPAVEVSDCLAWKPTCSGGTAEVVVSLSWSIEPPTNRYRAANDRASSTKVRLWSDVSVPALTLSRNVSKVELEELTTISFPVALEVPAPPPPHANMARTSATPPRNFAILISQRFYPEVLLRHRVRKNLSRYNRIGLPPASAERRIASMIRTSRRPISPPVLKVILGSRMHWLR